MTPADHLKKLEWAVWLSQVDLKTLGQREWNTLAHDLADFIAGSGGLTDLGPGWTHFYGHEPAQKLIGSVQETLKERLEKLAGMGAINVMRTGQGATRKKLSALAFLLNGRVQVQAFEGEPYMLLVKANRIESQVDSALASYLVSSGVIAGQIRKCPTCGRIFLYKRKPRRDVALHCSLKCSRLAATRRYRQKTADKLKAKERERSHQRYVRKQQRKYGPKVKVKRRLSR
jgi:hypothetical protein